MSQINIGINLTQEVSKVYYPLFETVDKPIKILYGGRDSAKTHTAEQYLLYRCLTDNYFRWVLIREYYNTIQDSQFEGLKNVAKSLGWEHYFEFLTSPVRINCVNGNGFIARGLDDAEKLKSLADVTGAWFEECDRISFREYDTVSTSLRSSKVEIVEEIHTFNSTSKNSFYVKEFFPPLESFEKENGRFTEVESTRDDTYILHTTFLDNEFLTEQRAKKLVRKIKSDPEQARVDVFGLFGVPKQGLVYKNFNIVSEVPEGRTCYGLDIGFNHPTALVKCTLDGEDVYLQEIIYQSGLTERNLIDLMDALQVDKDLEMFVDYAAASTIEELQRNGYNAKKADKRVELGIKFLQAKNIKVSKSPNLVKELQSYSYIKKGDFYTDKVIKDNDDGLDAARYGCFTGFSNSAEIKESYYRGFTSVLTETKPEGRHIQAVKLSDESKCYMLDLFINKSLGSIIIHKEYIVNFYDDLKITTDFFLFKHDLKTISKEKQRKLNQIKYKLKGRELSGSQYTFRRVQECKEVLAQFFEGEFKHRSGQRFTLQINQECKELIRDLASASIDNETYKSKGYPLSDLLDYCIIQLLQL